MSKKPATDDKSVQLKPKSSATKVKLDPAASPPKKVKVSVPKAKTVAVADKDADVHETGTPDAPLKKGEVLDRLVSETGVKRSDAKAILESFLAVMASELQAGKDFQLPPLGKIKLIKSKTVGQGASALTVKIRTPNPD